MLTRFNKIEGVKWTFVVTFATTHSLLAAHSGDVSSWLCRNGIDEKPKYAQKLSVEKGCAHKKYWLDLQVNSLLEKIGNTRFSGSSFLGGDEILFGISF